MLLVGNIPRWIDERGTSREILSIKERTERKGHKGIEIRHTQVGCAGVEVRLEDHFPTVNYKAEKENPYIQSLSIVKFRAITYFPRFPTFIKLHMSRKY